MSDTGALVTTVDPARQPKLAWRPVVAIAAVAVVVHLVVATRYGWHRDEFYYVITGRHPAWGYVDQPPLTPLLARWAAALPGGVLPLRVLAIACQAGCVLLGAKLAAEFGGGARAQAIAAGATAASVAFVAASVLFGTTVTDQLIWAAMFVAVARALRLRTTAAWSAAGLIGGIGLENKDTVAVLLLGVAIGLLVWHRDALRTPGPWLAGAVACLLAVPNVVWDARHGWPNLAMAQVLGDRTGGPLGALAQLPLLPLLAGPPLVVLCVLGVRRLGREPRHRWALVVVATAIVVFTAGGGKPYYPAPALIALFAAGAVRAEATTRTRLRWPAVIVVSGLIAILIGYPILPPRAENSVRVLNPTVMETVGWPEFVDQVKTAAAGLPAGTPILTSNYGEAGALTILDGPANPVFSGQNAYSDWGPPAGTPDTVLCVGEFKLPYLQRFWSDVRRLEPITMPNGVANQETDQHAAIYECRQPHGTWAQLWPSLKHYD
ncbi:glycosyltransferase family 39 protein [Amycolatopsis sp. RTGN1]|uniref:glycosyltransferase family 39 protein n=1 Tax=Amycolatopsis ponsaeliensis TaxID=2992142 RepID=UPI00254A5F88|nr:glycosyltransferase family 39 protein [Amycolatopsis sp. RTGN1]